MKKVGILITCAVLIAMVSMAGCADPEPEVAKTSGSATNSERESVTPRGPAKPDTRPAAVESRNGRDMAAVDSERANSESPNARDSRPPESRDSRSSESRGSRPDGPGMGVGSGIGGTALPGIRPPGENNLSDASSGIGMASRDNSSRNPASGRQPVPREYKLEFASASGAKGLEVGDTIPEVSGKDLDNIKFKLSDYQGKVIMLDFWGDW